MGGHDEPLAVASLNVLGLPLFGRELERRYRAIGAGFEATDVDIVCLQEVFTYRHLRLLRRTMPSFRHVAFRPSGAGPAAGLVIMARAPLGRARFRRFPLPFRVPELSPYVRAMAATRGVLTARTAGGLSVLNTHPIANLDEDWSPSNRFYGLQRRQITALARIVGEATGPLVLCGDFNVERGSALHGEFMELSGLLDAFGDDGKPTFRAEFLTDGKEPYCIDYILVSEGVGVEGAEQMFVDEAVSDHIGLRATLRP